MLLTGFLPHRCTAFTMTMTTVIYIYYIDYVDRVHKRTKYNARNASYTTKTSEEPLKPNIELLTTFSLVQKYFSHSRDT